MTSLHIAYLAHHFPPEIGAGPARVTEMARHWRDAGARVTVITGMPNRHHGRILEPYRGRAFMEDEWEGIRVLRSWMFARPGGGFAGTLANNLTFTATSALHGLIRARAVDVVIASSPPFFLHFGGEALKLVRRMPLVLELRDLWPDYVVDMGLIRNGIARRVLFALERHVLARADHAVVVTESFKRRLIGKGVPAGRVDVIPNGVDGAAYYRSDEAPPLPSLERREGTLVVGYLGNFGAGQGLTAVLEAARICAREAPAIRFVLAGAGPEEAQVRAAAERLSLPNLSLHGPIAKDATRAFYNACDICLVPLAPVPVFQETVPSKIFEVMACERPLIACLEGEGARIVHLARCGAVARPGDPGAIAEAIVRMARLPVHEREELGRRGRVHVLENYSRAALAGRYLDLLESVAAARRAPAAREEHC